MGMRDASNSGEFLVKQQDMRFKVRGRAQLALDYFTVQVGNHHVRRCQGSVFDPAGLDHHQAKLAVDAAGVAEGKEDQTLANQFLVGVEHLLLEGGQIGHKDQNNRRTSKRLHAHLTLGELGVPRQADLPSSGVEQQISPLRYAPVEMTKERGITYLFLRHWGDR